MFQDDVKSPSDLFIKPVLDFRIGAAVFQVVDELTFQQVLQFFPALFAGHEIVFRRMFEVSQPLLDGQGIDEFILPILDAKGQLTVHGIKQYFQFPAQPFPLFAFSVFPLIEPVEDAEFYILGNPLSIDDAENLGQGNAGHGRVLRFFAPLNDQPFQEFIEIVTVDDAANEIDHVLEHGTGRIFKQRNEAVFQEAH